MYMYCITEYRVFIWCDKNETNLTVYNVLSSKYYNNHIQIDRQINKAISDKCRY